MQAQKGGVLVPPERGSTGKRNPPLALLDFLPARTSKRTAHAAFGALSLKAAFTHRYRACRSAMRHSQLIRVHVLRGPLQRFRR
jgi:hypothetical protein